MAHPRGKRVSSLEPIHVSPKSLSLTDSRHAGAMFPASRRSAASSLAACRKMDGLATIQ
jgi:hypothetical protein